MAPHIETIAENFELAEGPHWDEETQSLYFIDTFNETVNRYVPATKKLTKASTGAYVAFIIPVKGQPDTFIITKENELRVIKWDGESDKISVIKTIDSGDTINFNDAKCDPTGRLWTGTLSIKDKVVEEGRGFLYKVEKDKITKVADKISVSNGLAFNTELKKFYYIDSYKQTVDEFDIDIEHGTIKNRHPIFTLSKHDIPGIPDGMTIDTDGNLWVAVFNGGRVIKIDPRKPETLLYTLSLPAKQVTSVIFGGRNFDELYITSGCFEFMVAEKPPRPENGSIYRVTGLGARGLPGEKFVL